MSTRPRIAPVAPGTQAEARPVEQRLRAARGSVSPLYQVLLNSVPIASGWEQLLTAVRQQTAVPPALRELIILRVAVLNRADYEFQAHVPHARQAGVDEACIAAVREPVPAAPLDTATLEVLALTDAMTRDIEVPDAVWAPIAQRHDARTQLELVTTVAAYNMVSRLLVALGVGH